MHAQYLVINQSTHWQILESLTEFFPKFETVFIKRSFAGIFETVNLVDESALVIASEHIHLTWPS